MRRTLALAAPAGPVCFVLTVAGLHLLRRDYDPLRRLLSEYALGPYGGLMGFAFMALALGSFALVAGLRTCDGPASQSPTGIFLLLLWSSGVLLAGLVPTDPMGVARSASGIVHDVAALVALLSLPAGAIVVSRRFRQHPAWRPLYPLALVLAFLTVPALLSWGVLGALGFVGLGQRVAVGAQLGWLLLVASYLQRVRAAAATTAQTLERC